MENRVTAESYETGKLTLNLTLAIGMFPAVIICFGSREPCQEYWLLALYRVNHNCGGKPATSAEFITQ